MTTIDLYLATRENQTVPLPAFYSVSKRQCSHVYHQHRATASENETVAGRSRLLKNAELAKSRLTTRNWIEHIMQAIRVFP